MNTVLNELTKLRGSLTWTVVALLPVVMVGAGVFSSLVNDTPLDDGWNTLWLRSTVFYGLLAYPLAIAVLAALVWRPEHRGGNWNALMSTPVPAARIVLAKTIAVAMLAAAMQVVLVLAVVAAGMLLGLEGPLPPRYLVASVLIVVASLPLAAFQSGAAMVLRSFGGPVALALGAAAVSTVLLVADVSSSIWVIPHALASRATQLGTGTFVDDGSLDAPAVVGVLGASALLTTLVLALTTATLARRDVRV